SNPKRGVADTAKGSKEHMVTFHQAPAGRHDRVKLLCLRLQWTEDPRVDPVCWAYRNGIQIALEVIEESMVAGVGRHHNNAVVPEGGERQQLEICVARPAWFQDHYVMLEDGSHVHAAAKGIETVRVLQEKRSLFHNVSGLIAWRLEHQARDHGTIEIDA